MPRRFTKPRTMVKRLIAWLLMFVMSLSLTLSWNLGHSIAKEPNFARDNQPPKVWQLEGTLAALDDTNPEVVVRALRKFSSLNIDELPYPLALEGASYLPREKYERIISLLDSDEPSIRAYTAKALSNLAYKANNHLPIVADLLNDITKFKAVGSYDFSPTHQGFIMSDDELNFLEVRLSAIYALGEMGEAAVDYAPRLADLLTDEDPNIRLSVIYALGHMGIAITEYVPHIADLLAEQDSDIQKSIAYALGEMGEAAASYAPHIVGLLGDENWLVRYYAAYALGEMGKTSEKYASRLADLLIDEDLDVRDSAAKALEQMGKTTADYAPRVADFIFDEDSDIRSVAVTALGEMKEAAANYAPLLVDLLTDKDSDVQSAAVRALGQMEEGTAGVISSIVDLLADEKSDIRSAAAQALGNIGKTAAKYAPYVADLLDDEKSDVRNAAILALGQMGKDADIYAPDLVKLLTNQRNSPSRYDDLLGRFIKISHLSHNVGEALGNLKENATSEVPHIIDMLVEEDNHIRDVIGYGYVLAQIGEAAAEYAPRINNLLSSTNSTVRFFAAYTLGEIGEKAAIYAPDVANLLIDEDSTVRSSAAYALGHMGKVAAIYAPDIAHLLADEDSNTQNSAKQALEQMGGMVDLKTTLPVLESIYRRGTNDAPSLRLLAYYVSGTAEDIENTIMMLQWLGLPKTTPADLNQELSRPEAEGVLTLFRDQWSNTEEYTYLRKDLANQIARIVKVARWNAKDIPLLQAHYNNLHEAGFNQDEAIRAVIIKLQTWRWGVFALILWLIHFSICAILFWLYPKNRLIQALFWNAPLRKIFGLGYIGLLLTNFPICHRRLFLPFRRALLAEASIDTFDPEGYFPDSNVQLRHTDNIQPLLQAIPYLSSPIILQGESGLGKSMFLRYLTANDGQPQSTKKPRQTSPQNQKPYQKRLVVFLPATKCANGVGAAIRAKIPLAQNDPNFLKGLIAQNALDICIDGLNEVTPDTRASISHFVEQHFNGHIIITTQPLDWIAPPTTKTYILQPLKREQIEAFLLSRQDLLTSADDAEKYIHACKDYLNEALNTKQNIDELTAIRRFLSNPMDLSIVAQMLAQGKQPDLLNLQQQQYDLMAAEFAEVHRRPFPLAKFAETAYDMRLADDIVIPVDLYANELSCLEPYKMVIFREQKDGREYYFRHDKIQEYFIVQTFITQPQNPTTPVKTGNFSLRSDRADAHIDDPRFRGIYLLLATLLNINEAMQLRETLLQRAVESSDHVLSDRYIQRINSRQELANLKQNNTAFATIRQFLDITDSEYRQRNEFVIATSMPGRLANYPAIALSFTPTPTAHDVTKLRDYVTGYHQDSDLKIGILIYEKQPDSLCRLRIAEVRLRDKFILIPISLAAITQNSHNKNDAVGLLAQYASRYLPGADFFDDRNAIADVFAFYGRSQLLGTLATELKRGQAIALMGIRKSGKTSVLLQLRFALSHHPVIYLDLQPYGGKVYFGADLFNKILKTLHALLLQQTGNTELKLVEFSGDRPAKLVASDFTKQVVELSKQLTAHQKKLPIICLIDEVERILPRAHDSQERVEEFNTFFGTLRELSQTQQCLAFLCADVHPDFNRINHWSVQPNIPTNPIFQFFKEIFIEPFEVKETQTMLTEIGQLMGIEFTPDLLTELQNLSGGHPFIARQLASFLCKKAERKENSHGEIITLIAAQPLLEYPFKSLDILKAYFKENIWADLNKRNFLAAMDALRLLACNINLTEGQLQLQLGDRPTSDLETALTWLKNVGLVKHQSANTQDEYRLQLLLLGYWLQREMTANERKQWQIQTKLVASD